MVYSSLAKSFPPAQHHHATGRHAAGVYNPIAVAETSASLGGSTVAGGLLEIFSGIAEAKLIYDTGVFVGAFAVCAFF